MTIVKMREAKSRLSRLVKDVQAGEEVIIVSRNKPVARLVPYTTKKPIRMPGFLRGKIWIASDFDDPLPEEAFERNS